MQTVYEYWQRVAEIKAELPETVYIISEHRPEQGGKANMMCEVNRNIAGKVIADRTHRLATEDEVKAHLAKQEEVVAAAEEAEINKRLVYVKPAGKEERGLSNDHYSTSGSGYQDRSI